MPYDAARDPYSNLSSGNLRALESATVEAAPAASDTVDELIYAKGFYVGGAGNVRYLPVGNADAAPITKACLAGTYHPIQVRRVYVTGTTATGIILQKDPL